MHPWIVKKILFPAHEAILKRNTMAYINDLEKTQWLSREDLEILQRQKLKKLLKVASDHCPWHAENISAVGMDLHNDYLPDFADLERLPLMTKQDAQLNINKLAWQGVPGGAYKYTTGGSSGNPLTFYFGKWRQASDAAGRIRARRWWGIDLGDKEIYLWGAPVELAKTDTIKHYRDRMMNQVLLNAFEMSPDNMKNYLQIIKQYRPKCIYGYASSIALLAGFAQNLSDPPNFPGLKVIFTTGEPLYPDQRALIENIFQVPVANEFGSRDIGFTAHESPKGQMLLMSESIILEVLDQQGNSVKPGEIGEAVMTGLCSDAQPFIRYRTGDMVKSTEQKCIEGRGLHVLGEVLGRSTDFIIKQDGTIMHALAVIYVLRAIEGIDTFKIIQHSTKELEVQIVTNALWLEQYAGKITEELQQRLGSIDVKINNMDNIAPESSGKHRYVISHVSIPSYF